VPRASTHLDYSDIPYVLPASRYGQDLTSVYVQAWLDRYLKHQGEPDFSVKAFRHLRKRAHHRRRAHHGRRTHHTRRAHKSAVSAPDPLQATSFTYLEPVAIGKWEPVQLDRSKLLSFYFCSGWSYHDASGRLVTNDCRH